MRQFRALLCVARYYGMALPYGVRRRMDYDTRRWFSTTMKGYGSGAVWLPSLGALFRKHGYIGVSEGFLKGQY